MPGSYYTFTFLPKMNAQGAFYKITPTTPDELAHAVDLTGHLFKPCNLASQKYGLPPAPDYEPVKAKPRGWFARKEIFRLSLDPFEHFNTLTPTQYVSLIQKACYWSSIKWGLYKNPLILNFQEPKRDNSPYHLFVDEDPYLNQTSLFTYQLAKAILNQMHPYAREKTNIKKVLEHIRETLDSPREGILLLDPDYPHNHSLFTLTSSLDQIIYFDSIIEAYTHFKLQQDFLPQQELNFTHRHVLLGLGANTHDWEHLDMLLTLDNLHVTELVLVIHNRVFQDATQRQLLHERLLNAARASQCTTLLQVVLLTGKIPNRALADIAPSKVHDADLFQTLAHDAGYYLSSLVLRTQIIRQYQKRYSQAMLHRPMPAADDSPPCKPLSYDVFINSFSADESKTIEPEEIKSPPPSSKCVIATTPHPDMNPIKNLSDSALKSSIELTMAWEQQRNLAQEHTAQHDHQVQNAQQLSQHVSQQSSRNQYWEQRYIPEYTGNPGWHDISFLAKKLTDYAKNILKKYPKEDVALERILFTTDYTKHFGRKQFLQRLATKPNFAMELAAKIFCAIPYTVNGKQQIMYIPGHSTQGLEFPLFFEKTLDELLQTLCSGAETFVDGLDPNYRKVTVTKFSNKRALKNIRRWLLESDYVVPYMNDNVFLFSYLSHLNNKYQGIDHYSLLLDEFALNETKDRAELIDCAQHLLTAAQYTPQQSSPPSMHVLTQSFSKLVSFYFPKNPEYLQYLQQFFSIMEEDPNNIKLMVQVVINGHREALESFLKLIAFLQSKSQLKFFYNIYFKFAPHTLFVSELLYEMNNVQKPNTPAYETHQGFIDLLKYPPLEKPLFHEWCWAMLHFAAKNHHGMGTCNTDRLRRIWEQYYQIMFSYTGQHASSAETLRDRFITNLLSTGLISSTHCYRHHTTLITGLQKLLVHTADHHTLEEQLNELNNLSFAWPDVPLAINFPNNTAPVLRVVCEEMCLRSEYLAHDKTYSISRDGLWDILTKRPPEPAFIKRSLFRYLGTVSLREPLAYYRTLYEQCITPDDAAPLRHAKELFIAFVIWHQTGPYYQSEVTNHRFHNEFISQLKAYYPKGVVVHSRSPTSKEVMLPAEQVLNQISPVIYEHLKSIPTQAQLGQCSLVKLWRKDLPLDWNGPGIATRTFEYSALKTFLLTYAQALGDCAAHLPEEGTTFVFTVIKHLFPPDELFEKTCVAFLMQAYPNLSWSFFSENMAAFINFASTAEDFIKHGGQELSFHELTNLIKSGGTLELATALIHLCTKELAATSINKEQADRAAAGFIKAVIKKPSLINNLETHKIILGMMFKSWLTSNKPHQRKLILKAGHTLSCLPQQTAIDALTPLLHCLANSKGLQFFVQHQEQLCNPENLSQLGTLWRLIDDAPLALSLFNKAVHDPNSWAELIKYLTALDPTHRTLCLTLMQYLPEQNPIKSCNILGNLSIETLKELIHIQKIHHLSSQELSELIEKNPSLTDLTQWSKARRALYEHKFEYDEQSVSAFISQITYKNTDKPLEEHHQAQLKKDYEDLITCVNQAPLYNDEKLQAPLTMLHADDHHLADAFALKVRQGNSREDYIMKLAIACVTLYRTQNQVPRPTQILPVLVWLLLKGSVIHEIQTGEGKTITSLLHTLVVYDGVNPIDISTENKQLALEMVSYVQRACHFLRLLCGQKPIQPTSRYEEYQLQGINICTPSDISLFFTQQLLEGHAIPRNASLICDEVDSAWKSPVEFCLADLLDARFKDADLWNTIYKALIEFVDTPLFKHNPCSKQEDAANFIYFLQEEYPENQRLQTLVHSLIEDRFDLFLRAIRAAKIAPLLQENVDFRFTKDKEGAFDYAAPMIESRPNAHVQFSHFMQEVLHAFWSLKYKDGPYQFSSKPFSEGFLKSSPFNFFARYKLIIGFTGTAGIAEECLEAEQNFGLVTYTHPRFYPSKLNDLGIQFARSPKEHQLLLVEKIQHYKQHVDPTQPILILTDSPKCTLNLQHHLAPILLGDMQLFHGHAEQGVSEEQVIQQAGQYECLTLANGSLTRGANVGVAHSDAHPLGLFVILFITASQTPEKIKQGLGRTARGGKPGTCWTLVDLSTCVAPDTVLVDPFDFFANHQRGLVLAEQQQRRNKLPLIKLRYLLLFEHFLPWYHQTNALLRAYYGADFSLSSQPELNKYLRDLVELMECDFDKLPVTQDAHQINLFITTQVQHYQAALEKITQQANYQNFEPKEPLMPLHVLQDLNLKLTSTHLTLISDLLGIAYSAMGHNRMTQVWEQTNKCMSPFLPYFRGECGIKTVSAELILEYKLTTTAQVIDGMKLFELDAINMLESFQTLELPPEAGWMQSGALFAIKKMLPVDKLSRELKERLNSLIEIIHNKRWEALNTELILGWAKPILTALSTSPWVAKYLVLPGLSKVLQRIVPEHGEIVAKLSSELCKALAFLLSLPLREEISTLTLGEILDNLAPLIGHEALLNLITSQLEDHLPSIFYVKQLPHLLEYMKAHRDRSLKDLEIKKLLALLPSLERTQELANMLLARDCINVADCLNLLMPSSCKEFLEQLPKAAPETAAFMEKLETTTVPKTMVRFLPIFSKDIMSELYSLKERIVGFIQVISHPRFNHFLKQIPAIDFSDLIKIFEQSKSALPEALRSTVRFIDYYQTHHQTVLQRAKDTLGNLYQQHQCSEKEALLHCLNKTNKTDHEQKEPAALGLIPEEQRRELEIEIEISDTPILSTNIPILSADTPILNANIPAAPKPEYRPPKPGISWTSYSALAASIALTFYSNASIIACVILAICVTRLVFDAYTNYQGNFFFSPKKHTPTLPPPNGPTP